MAIFVAAGAVSMGGLVATSQQADAATREPFRVSIANIGSRSDPDLGPMIDQRKPQVMVVSEAYFARTKLQSLATKYGYRLKMYTEADGHEARDVALLIRNNVTIKSVTLMKMNDSWSYNGKTREPRRYPVAVVTYLGKTWNVIGVHYPTGGPGGGNKAAWNESKTRVQAYAANHVNTPTIAAGDFNPAGASIPNTFPGFLTQGQGADWLIVKKDRGARFEGAFLKNAIRNTNSHGWFTFNLSGTV